MLKAIDLSISRASRLRNTSGTSARTLGAVKLAGLDLRQRDGITCGPTVAVVAGALLDPSYEARLADRAWFEAEQGRLHAELNRIWPRRLGTTPSGMARALTEHSSARYRWRLFRGRRDKLADVARAVEAGWPVAMLIGRFVPRHWVLIVEASGDGCECYEPSSGEVRTVGMRDVRRSRLTGLGYPRPFAFVLPSSVTRSATS
jgi:hypothetical protein